MLKKITFSLALLCAGANIFAQIKNGSFENWTAINYTAPAGWFSLSNAHALSYAGDSIVTKVPGNTGTGILLETLDDYDYSMIGTISNSNGNIFDGEGGVPYSQQPSFFRGFYKADIQPGDEAIIGVIFKKSGSIISNNTFKINASETDFTQFVLPLSLASVPDSVIIFATSSNADNNPVKGTYIVLDDLGFSGTNITQPIPGGDFESWTNKTFQRPVDWSRSDDGVLLTSDAQQGTSAVLLETYAFFGQAEQAIVSNGRPGAGTMGGMPYTQDTLVFYYKYIPAGGDSAMVYFSYSSGGQLSVYTVLEYLPATAAYKRMEMPVPQSPFGPDTVRIDFFSSHFGFSNSNIGSKLYLDNIFLKSAGSALSVGRPGAIQKLNVFPNPAAESINFSFISAGNYTAELQVMDITGKKISGETIAVSEGVNYFTLPVSGLCEGLYFYRIIAADSHATSGNFIKQ
jgi:hypothetical protein